MAKKPPETNPFVQALEIKGLWKLDIEEINGTEGASKITQAKSNLIDIDERISVYTNGLLNWFKDLSSCAKDMFMYIGTHLGWEKDVIEIDEDRYCEEMEVSRRTFYAARQALTNRLIIPRTSRKNTYWVNPTYLFKGDRVMVYRGNVKPTNDNPLDKLRSVRADSTVIKSNGYRSIQE